MHRPFIRNQQTDLSETNSPISRNLQYGVIKKDNIEIFIYKLENSYYFGRALGEFLDSAECIDMLSCHETNKEQYQYIYDQLKKELIIPENIISDNYDNDKMRHFYSEEEIVKLKDKWMNKSY